MSSFSFRHQHVFVSGGSSGINLGIAKAFARAGAHVVVMSRSADKVAQAAAELEALGAQALGLKSIAVQAPELAGDTALGVNPRDRALLEQLNEALDRIKRDGRFDRINTRFIPFRLQ